MKLIYLAPVILAFLIFYCFAEEFLDEYEIDEFAYDTYDDEVVREKRSPDPRGGGRGGRGGGRSAPKVSRTAPRPVGKPAVRKPVKPVKRKAVPVFYIRKKNNPSGSKIGAAVVGGAAVGAAAGIASNNIRRQHNGRRNSGQYPLGSYIKHLLFAVIMMGLVTIHYLH